MKKWRDPSFISLIVVFAVVTLVCDSLVGPSISISSVWYSWIFIAEPVNGIVLGPYASFFSTFIGVMVGHSIYVRDSAEFVFTLGAPIGAVISSLIFRRKWKIALAYYSVLLASYFGTPVSWQLPFWGMWNVYLAFSCLLASVLLMRKVKNLWNVESGGARLLLIVALCTFIGLEADVLFRVFVLVPCQTYWIVYGLDVSTLQSWWALGAVETSTKAAFSTFVSIMVSPSIIKAVRKMGSSLLKS